MAAYPERRSFAAEHAVHCHAVNEDGRLRDPASLPLLPSAQALAGHDPLVDASAGAPPELSQVELP